MSVYTTDKCIARAEAARCGLEEQRRICREHGEAAETLDGDAARLARGYALIAQRRLDEQQWRARAYARLARGEDIT